MMPLPLSTAHTAATSSAAVASAWAAVLSVLPVRAHPCLPSSIAKSQMETQVSRWLHLLLPLNLLRGHDRFMHAFVQTASCNVSLP